MNQDRKEPPQENWTLECVKMLVLRDGKWVVLNEGTFPAKKGEMIRVRGQRDVYELHEDSQHNPDGGVEVIAHLVGEVTE